MSGKTWRGVARPIIRKALSEGEGMPERELRRLLREAYPFGERKHHPYKVWLDEIKVQRGLKKGEAAKADKQQLKLL